MTPGQALLRMGAAWALTRCAVVLWWTITSFGAEVASDLNRYAYLAAGVRPPSGEAWVPWEYPSLARMVLSTDVGFDVPAYTRSVILLLLVIDALFTVWLWSRQRVTGATLGVWLWVLAVPLLAAVPYTRYDLIVAVLVAVSLGSWLRHPRTAGLILSGAIALKLWPLVLVPILVAVTGRSRRVQVVLWSILPWIVIEIIGVAAWGARSFTAPWAWQWGRGVHLESIPATAAHWLSAAGDTTEYRFNAYELVGWEWLAAAVSTLGLAIIGWILLRSWNTLFRGSLDSSRREIVMATASLAAISVLLATGKVLSPQYLLWLLAPLALFAGRPEIVDRKVPFLMAAACALTTVVYPVTYPGLLADDLLPWVSLTLRNGCLWWLCILLVTRWYTVTRSSGPGRQVVVRGEELAR